MKAIELNAECHAVVALAAILLACHQVCVGDEADTVFIHQHLASEMHRLGGLATLVQVDVRLKHAEELVAVGNRLAFQNTPGVRAADLMGQTHELLQLSVAGHDLQVNTVLDRHRRPQLLGTVQDHRGQIEQLPIQAPQPSLIAGSLPGGNALDLTCPPLDRAVQMPVLPRVRRDHSRVTGGPTVARGDTHASPSTVKPYLPASLAWSMR